MQLNVNLKPKIKGLKRLRKLMAKTGRVADRAALALDELGYTMEQIKKLMPLEIEVESKVTKKGERKK